MLVILITHADRRKSASRSVFGGLSDQGRAEVKSAANRFWALRRKAIQELNGDEPVIEKVVTSPMARCVETAVLFAKELHELTQTPQIHGSSEVSEIHVRQELKEKGHPKTLTINNLDAVIATEPANTILICTHGDLAGVLSSTAKLAPGSYGGQWFNLRPVIALVEVDPNIGFAQAKILCCEGYNACSWENLLV